MPTAQEFIRELRVRRVLNDKYIAIIEQSLLQPAEEIPAADLAGYLVEQMIISAAVSNAILDHLQASGTGRQTSVENVKHQAPSPKPDDTVNLVPTSRPAEKKPPASHTVPEANTIPQPPSPKTRQDSRRGTEPPVPTSPPEKVRPVMPPPPKVAPPDDVFEASIDNEKRTIPLKEASWRIKETKRESQWDTPLVKYGIIALGLMVLASVVLAWLLVQRRADEVLALADEAWQNGAYAQAMDGYKDFVASFENNAAVPKAKLRIALSRIRLITETKSNWDKALVCVQEELPEMSRLPDFASEGRIELSAILPNIAEGLAAMADSTDNADWIRQSETALALVVEHVPGTMQPFNQMQTTRRSLELTRRRIASDTEIVTVKTEVSATLDAIHAATSDDPAVIRQQLAQCYAMLLRYLHANPEMRDNSVVAAIKSDIARMEASCQTWVTAEVLSSEQSEVVNNSTLPAPPVPVMLLTHRVVNETQNSTLQTPNSSRLFISYANQNVYAINPNTGSIVWRHHVGLPGLDRNVPMVIPGLPYNNTLLADNRSNTLLMVDTTTGMERFRLALGETAYFNPQPTGQVGFVTTSGGKLTLVNLATGERIGHIDLMQNADAPPCYDPERQLVVQPAHHSALHVFRYDAQATVPLTNIGIIPTGHLAGTIQSPPMVHKGHLFIAEQTAPTRTTIKIFAPTVGGQPVPWSEQPVQTIPFDGLVQSPPIIDDNDLLYMAQRGDVKLISHVGTDPMKPYQIVADGRIDDSLKPDEAVSGRFALMAGRSLWVADNRLQHFEVQPSRSRLIPQSVPTTSSILSPSPMEIVDGHLMQTYIDPVMGGVTARSFALSNLANRWQTEFGEVVLAPPVVSAAGETLHLVTVTGKLYDLPVSELTMQRDMPIYNTESYMRQRVAPGTLTEPVTDLVPLDNRGAEPSAATTGLEVLCCISPNTEMTNLPIPSTIRVYDSQSPQSQIRTITVPAPLTSAAVPLDQGIVVPLANGQLAFYSPRDGTVIGNPFVTRRTQDAPPKWSPMTLIDSAILIGDADGLLRQIELVTQNNRPALVMTKSVQLPCGVSAKPLVCGRNLIIADHAGNLLLLDYDQWTEEGNVLEFGVAESKPLQTPDSKLQTWELDGPIVWGPFPCGPNAVVVVTVNHTLVVLTKADQPLYGGQDAGGQCDPQLATLKLEHGIPIGRPFAINETQMLFITRKGTLLRYDLPQNSLTPIHETGVTPGCGPVVVGSKIVVLGNDGAVYAF